ncbi:unnamed protein product, partial [Staurois parvus]
MSCQSSPGGRCSHLCVSKTWEKSHTFATHTTPLADH